MKVLVSGGSGFIGNRVVLELVQDGHEVTLLSRKPKKVHSSIQYISVDGLVEFFDLGCDVVIHLATDYGRKGSIEKAWEANYYLPKRLLELAKLSGVRLFINTDSFYTHHSQVFIHLKEYIATKNAFKKMFLSSKAPSLKKVNMVLSHVIGSGDAESKFLPWVLDQLIDNNKVLLTKCEQQLDFIDVGDVAKAFSLVVKSESLLKDNIEFEIGSGRVTQLKNLLALMYGVVKNQVKVDDGLLMFGSRREGNINGRFSANINEISQLGWNCNVSISQSIHSMVEERIR